MSGKAAVASAALLPVFGLVLGLTVIGAGGAGPAGAAIPTAAVCATTGPLTGLSDVAASNARIVAAVAMQRGGMEAAIITVTVGLTESGLRILGNTTVDTGSLPVQGIGSDHDSIGIFQQRPSWGTIAQRLDPVISTHLFLTRLLADPGWQTKPVWVAAQDVQVSAFDGRPRAANGYNAEYGGNYARHVAQATAIVSLINDDAAKLYCGQIRGGKPADSSPGSHGLPDDYAVPATATPEQARVVSYAISQLDKPYVFGAAGPDAFDCSGLAKAAWAQVGVQLPHSTLTQTSVGLPTTRAALAPGDLVLVPGEHGTLAAPDHVGLYLGDDLVINAADEQTGLRVQTFDNFVAAGNGLSALRHIA